MVTDPWANVEIAVPGRVPSSVAPPLPHDQATFDSWQKSLRGCGLTNAQFVVLVDVGIEAAEGYGPRPADLIAEAYGLTPRTVRRHLRYLEQEGWLRRSATGQSDA